MKKSLSILFILFVSITFITAAMATSAGQNKDGAGYYQHSVTGQIKYFKDHPGEPSQWRKISDPADPEDPCEDGCKSKGKIQGTFDQSTGAWKASGKVEVEDDTVTVNNGAFASASENGGGAYFGKYTGDKFGIGGAGSLGGSLAYTDNTKNSAIAGAIAGNVSAAGIGGDLNKSCATIYGDGNHVTLALKEGKLGSAYGTTNGQFTYSGQTGNGLVIGGGVTGGLSGAYVDANTAGAFAGGATVSGVGNIGMSTPQ